MTIRLTDEERTRLASAMVDTWQAIAPDIHECFALDARESGKRKHVSASALVELVCWVGHTQVLMLEINGEYESYSAAYVDPESALQKRLSVEGA